MIGIGVQMGGPEQKDAPIKKALTSAMGIAERVRDPDFRSGDEAWVNPIFIVPGSLLKPEFEGYELGHFSKREKGLVVQIAVPEPVAKGEGIVEFIGESLREVIRLAASFFASNGISFSTLKAEKVVRAIESGVEEVMAR